MLNSELKLWLVNAEGTFEDGTDVYYHHSYRAHDAAEAWCIFSENRSGHVNFYRISVTEVIMQ